MKIGGFIVVVGLLLPGVALANSFVGVWSTEEDKSRVEIKACADDEAKLCGTIIWLKEPLDDKGKPKTDKNNPEEQRRGRPILGLPLLSGFEKTDDPKVWGDGKIYNPEDGEVYSCTMELLSDGVLEVLGYIGIPLFGKTQEWQRVK
jgi:uncharacterized protein (DUF2147 family)